MQQNMMDQNIIITEPSSNLRALGRNALNGKWKLAIIAVIVYNLCLQVPPAILNALFGKNLGDLYYNYGYGNMYYGYDYYSFYDTMPSYSGLSGIYSILVVGAFTLGITLFFLALFRRQVVGITDIFLGFERFGKALGLFMFQALFIFLWTLLFIVPGIIAAIRYSQAFFIFADDPNKSIRECMNESKRMMKGNKSKYFCLGLSFIGWLLLSSIPASVLESVAAALYAPAWVQAIVAIIGSMFIVPVTAYMYSTFSGFYEILAGHLIKETVPAPIDPVSVPVEIEENDQPSKVTDVEEPVSAPVEESVLNESAPEVEEKPQVTEIPEIHERTKSKKVDVATVFAEFADKDAADKDADNK